MEIPSTFLTRARAAWWVVVFMALTLPGTLATLTPMELPAILARNVLLLMGISYWTARLIGSNFGWVTGLSFLGLTVMFGTTDFNGEAQWWAVLLHPPADLGAWLLTLVVSSSAWWAYAHRDIPTPTLTLTL